MIKVLFVCLGNICRSPMAQYVLQDMVNKQKLAWQFYIDSAATSTEEIGNGVHYGTRSKLKQVGIPVGDHRAVQVKKSDYEKYDYIIGMDQWNMRNMKRIFREDPEHKLRLLLDFSARPGDISDPWYTGNFDETYRDVKEGCEGFLQYLKEHGKI